MTLILGFVSDQEISSTDNVCVASSTGLYEITVRSLHNDGSGGLRLSDNSSTPTFINYTISWDDLQGTGFVELNHGRTSPGFSGADTVDPECATTGPTAKLRVTVDPNTDFIGNVRGQLYNDILTITAGIL